MVMASGVSGTGRYGSRKTKQFYSYASEFLHIRKLLGTGAWKPLRTRFVKSSPGKLSDRTAHLRQRLHPLLSKTGSNRVPRPFGPAVQGFKPNALAQFDYLEMCPSRTGRKSVLMLRDDKCNYCWLFPFPNTHAENVAHTIIYWSAAFAVLYFLLSDGPTHFRNQTVRLVTKALRIKHDFTLPYFAWSNDAVKRLAREVLRVARAVLSELQLPHDAWPDLVLLFQSTLNNTPSRHRSNTAPIKAFTGLQTAPPISKFIFSDTGNSITVPELVRTRALEINHLQDVMEQLHPVIDNSLTKNCGRSREAAGKGQMANFARGDFVPMTRELFHSGEKLCLHWRGPRRVVGAVNDYVYIVEDLRTGAIVDAYATRLKFYFYASLDAKAILSYVFSSETGMQVSRLLPLVEENGVLGVVIIPFQK